MVLKTLMGNWAAQNQIKCPIVHPCLKFIILGDNLFQEHLTVNCTRSTFSINTDVVALKIRDIELRHYAINFVGLAL